MRLLRSDHVTGWLFVAPATVLLVAFGLIPIGWSALLSFQHNDLLSAPHWVGTANYRALQHDPVFRKSVRNTVEYTLLFVPISIGLALAAAVDDGGRLLPLAAGVPVLRGRLRRGDRLRALPSHPGRDGHPARRQPPGGALHVMSLPRFSLRHLFLAPFALLMATPLIWM